MSGYLRRISIVGAFASLCLLLTVSGVITYHRVQAQIGWHQRVLHTQQVLGELHRTLGLLVDAETGQRGYLITDARVYLEPYETAQGHIGSQIDKLATLTADHPAQQARIAKLRVLAHNKLNELAATIQLQQSGDASKANEIVLSNAGKQSMDSIRQLLQEMEQEELRLEEIESQQYLRSAKATSGTVIATTVLGILSLIVVAVLILQSIRSKERHNEEISNREKWYRVTLGSVGDGVIATDPSGKITFLNPVAEDLTGHPLAEARNQPLDQVFRIFNEQTLAPVENPVQKVIETGKIIGLANHTVLERKDGSRVSIADSAAPIRDDNQNLIGVVLVFRDSSEERHKEDLIRRTEKLAVAGRLASTMAHEINNPLEATLNLVFMARTSPELPDSLGAALLAAEQELNRVAQITKQTLGFYRESPSFTPVQVGEIVDSVLEVFGNKIRNRGVNVTKSFAETGPILAQASDLRQLVANLISNSIDATAQGGSINIHTDPASSGGIELTIEDDGVGIDSKHLPRLFEPFFSTKQDVGTGLGLWVCKTIVERHGGSIRAGARSNGQRGARFTVFLPSAQQAQTAGE